MNRWWLTALVAVLGFFALGPPAGAGEKAKPPHAKETAKRPVLTEPVEFALDEVPAFGQESAAGGRRMRYPQGVYAPCGNAPNRDVKYPPLKSKRPLYGTVTFGRGYYDSTPGISYSFVLDESGEQEKKGETDADKADKGKPDAKSEKKSVLLKSLAKSLAGTVPVVGPVSRAQQPTCRFDRLYFDVNGDRDLTNDGVIQLADKPPFAGLPDAQAMPNVRYFAELALPFEVGPPQGKRPFVLVPRVQAYDDYGYVEFLPKTARKGKIRLGNQEYIAWLTQSRTIYGRYDRAWVQLEIVPAAGGSTTAPLKSGPLGQMQVVDGKYWTLSATPLGDKLTIAPYRGELGTLELGGGGRAITEFGLVGQLIGQNAIVPLGEASYAAPESLPRRYQVPVGDYKVPSLTAQYGRLRFSARMQTTSDAVHPVQIRKDKPFVLEFSGKPEVKFTGPDTSRTFKPGDTIYIGAMLHEPQQGMQITGLWDATQKKGVVKYSIDGREVAAPRYADLDPTIVIRNSAGAEVATGKMPFG